MGIPFAPVVGCARNPERGGGAAMQRHWLWIGLLSIVLFGPPFVSGAEQAGGPPRVPSKDSSRAAEQARTESGEQLIIRGPVTQVHAPRLFTVEHGIGDDREVLVLAPRAISTPVRGAIVEVGGVLRSFEEAELKHTEKWNEIDERTREGLVGRSVLVATFFIATRDDELQRPAVESQSIRIRPSQSKPLTLRPVTVGNYIEELAGQHVKILNARVVGLFDPRAFLIESATRHLELMGRRDRLLVLIDGAGLRIPAESIVGSTVTVVGVARSVIGAQVTREVPWPAKLDRDLIERLEVRAAVLASSVQTPEGTELTERLPTAAAPPRSPAPIP
jgi:hypothetical protein